MADPAADCPIIASVTAGIEEIQDGTKTAVANKNGKKAESRSSGSGFFTWFIVLALLGVWTSVAVVYFDLVDYQGVLGKLVAYDTDGDGDFDVEDAKVLLDDKAGETLKTGAKTESSRPKDVGLKLREALKQQLALIHERVEAKKLARLALAEVRHLLAKEEEAKELEVGRTNMSARVRERVAARLKDEEEKMEQEEMEKVLEKLRTEKNKQPEESKTSKEDKTKRKVEAKAREKPKRSKWEKR